MSLKEIEKIAWNILLKANIVSYPVKLDSIAEFSFELEFDWRDFPEQDHSSKILAAISIGDKKIYLNSSHEAELASSLGRRNFTIAHEPGHWVLHK